MSAERTIRCNGQLAPGTRCLISFPLDAGVTVTDARAILRRQGWHARPGGRDVCPDCWSEGQR